MAWLNGRVERQLVTALLLVALLVSCGVVGRAEQAPTATPEPTVVADQPGDPEPTADDPAAPTAAPAASAAPAATAPPVAAQSSAAPSSAAPSSAAGPPSATPVASAPPPSVAPSASAAPSRAPSTSPIAKGRLVTYYGHPYSDKMGILGEFDDPQQMVNKLKEQTAAYTAADPSRPAICTIELIASVAQGSPGADGLFILRTPTKVIEEHAQLAERNGCLLMLDIQMGLDTVQNDIAAILPFLQRPYVHLAIDPEFHVKRGQLPGDDFGSLSAAEVAYAANLLGELVRTHNLPDKVLVLHQFRDDMLPDKQKIVPVPNVDMVVMMDGWGTIEAKTSNYQYFIKEQPLQYGGIKLFYRQDVPLLTPQQVLQLDPIPLVVIYQ